jgi:hypothetical protein
MLDRAGTDARLSQLAPPERAGLLTGQARSHLLRSGPNVTPTFRRLIAVTLCPRGRPNVSYTARP